MMRDRPCSRCGATFGPEPVFDRFWREWRATCGHCGLIEIIDAPAEESDDDPPAAYYVPTECPHCHGTDCPVTSKPTGGLRHHKCRACGRCFKSQELTVTEILERMRRPH